MRLLLALASLRRNRARTILAVLGVAIAAAMLLDMVMLSTGMRESFRELLLSRGFQMRLTPRGTLPFDTEASIADATSITSTLRARPEIDLVSPVLGASVHVLRGDSSITTFALGVDPSSQGDYQLASGHDATAPNSFVANEDFLRATHARIGDTLRVASGFDPQLRTHSGERALVLAGRARFLYLAAGQLAVAVPLHTLQEMTGAAREDRVSLFMVRLRDPSRITAVKEWMRSAFPAIDVISTADAMARVDERLSYFRQLSAILGAVSLIVGFLLVTTLVTVSVNERVGEIVVMRAIGVSRAHVVQQIVLEGTAMSITGAVLGTGLGLITARYLNAILSRFPGLPAAIDFFLFQPRAAWTAIGLLTACGVLAGLYPAWRAASLPLASTLREEAVA
jgi:putative ABC transport system permease protein